MMRENIYRQRRLHQMMSSTGGSTISSSAAGVTTSGVTKGGASGAGGTTGFSGSRTSVSNKDFFPLSKRKGPALMGGGGRDFGEPLGLARLFSSLEAERQRRKRKRRAHASHERGKEQQLCGLRGVTTSGDQRCFFSGKRNECFKQEESSSSCSGRGSRHEVSREGESQTEHNATEWHRECFQQGLSSASRPRDEIQRLGKGTGPPRLR